MALSRSALVTRGSRRAGVAEVPGGHTGGATPVPIPNTVVKPSRADGTALVTVRESRSPPGLTRGARVARAARALSSSELAEVPVGATAGQEHAHRLRLVAQEVVARPLDARERVVDRGDRGVAIVVDDHDGVPRQPRVEV